MTAGEATGAAMAEAAGSGRGGFTIAVVDRVSIEGLQPLVEDDRFRVVEVGGDGAELEEVLAVADAIVLRSATQIDAEFLRTAPDLKVIGRAGVGVDNIDIPAATARGVAVLNAPAGNTISAAELTLALLLAAVRKVAAADRSLREGKWDRKSFAGTELRGKALGLIGAGRIGSEVARRARAFEMSVLAYDPYLPEARAEEIGIELVSLDQVFERADVISLHVPLTPATRGIVGKEQFARMKSSALLLNVGRGGLVDEEALVRALTEGRIAGAALDVFEEEPLPEDSPLRAAPNLVLTPHLGASTAEAQAKVAAEIAQAVKGALLEGDFSRALNAPALGGETLKKVRPLLDLAGRMGRLACALASGGIESMELRYAGTRGGSEQDALQSLSAAFVAGVLSRILGPEEVNYVNARHLAEQRGIRTATSSESRHSDYAEYLEATVDAEGGRIRVAGALLGERHPRIVGIDEYAIDLAPHGTMIVLRNQDVPGVIGRVGTLLGERGINIAGYHQSRKSPGGGAMAAVSVDGEVTEDLLAALLELPEVIEARMAQLD